MSDGDRGDIGLHATARRAGSHRWSELAVWHLLGGWAPQSSAAAVIVALDVHSQHAAWRAGQWWDRLPVLAGVDRDALATPPGPGAAAVKAMGGGDRTAPRSDVARLAAAYRVLLPRLVTGYADDHRWAALVADGPHLRTLAQVAADASADWAEGEALLQSLLVTADDVADAAATVARLEGSALGDEPSEAAQ